MTLFAMIISRQIAMFHKHKSGIILIGSAIGFLIFIAIGAALFMVVEGTDEEDSEKAILEAKEKIRKKYQVKVEALDDFLVELTIIGIRGIPKKNATKWEFADSWFFSVTLLTTVGYGHVTPSTLAGKIIAIAYSAIGIPLTMFHLTTYVQILLKLSEKLKAAMFRKYEGRIDPFFIRFVHAGSLTSFCCLICFVLPGSIFASLEKDWGVFDGIYFCFISLTTIGLGDMVPAMKPDMPHADLYKIGSSFYLLGGLTMMMFMMPMLGDFFLNCRKGYQLLPFTVPTEKFPINPGTVHTYGSILTQSGKSEADEKRIIQYDQLAT